MINFTLERLLSARKAGRQIDSKIVLSLVDHVRFWEKYRWPTIRINNLVDPGFLALTGLDVLIVHMDYAQKDMLLLLEAIMQFNPLHLETWDLREGHSKSVICDGSWFIGCVPKPTILLGVDNESN
jgi:hypothetical protein